MQKTSLWALFSTFFKIGLFTFGGGYAMLPVISSICVEEKEWITSDEMLNITVIAESTPGPMSINCATYVGYRQGGIPGSIATTVGTVLPSFLIIFTISMFLDNFLEITFIANAFKGIQGAVGILIVDAAITMIRKMKRTPLAMGILLVATAVLLLGDLLLVHISSIALMVAAGLVGFAIFAITGQKGGAEE
ncbi:MAG: chromate transporter [Angelakisella sp.]|jgi:chromate transporter|nr:chromate transporter [Angelakisella sp.]